MKTAGILGLLTLLAVGSALGVNLAAKRALAIPEGKAPPAVAEGSTPEAAPATPEAAPVTPVRSKRAYLSAILDRNIFDASAIGRSAVVSQGEEGVETDLDLDLVGTLVVDPSEFSSAMIARRDGDGVARGYGLGDMILDAKIVEIHTDRVVLERSDGVREVLPLDDEEEDRTPTRSSAPAAQGSDNDQVEKVSETEFVVERDLLDKYMSDLDSLSRLGRAIPHRGPDGSIDGYRLSGIRRKSLGEQLGIKNGDIVHSVNGHALTSMQGAMAAYTTLQSESKFTFEVTRRGSKMTMQYDVD